MKENSSWFFDVVTLQHKLTAKAASWDELVSSFAEGWSRLLQILGEEKGRLTSDIQLTFFASSGRFTFAPGEGDRSTAEWVGIVVKCPWIEDQWYQSIERHRGDDREVSNLIELLHNRFVTCVLRAANENRIRRLADKHIPGRKITVTYVSPGESEELRQVPIENILQGNAA